MGKYQLLADTTNYISIYKEGDRLFADLSNKTGTHMALYPQADTLFFVPVVKRVPTYIEFILKEGKAVGLYSVQDKKYEAKKVE